MASVHKLAAHFRVEVLGRSDDLDSLGRILIAGPKVVSLVGPGGVGKTTLAAQILRAQLEDGSLVILTLDDVGDEEALLSEIRQIVAVGPRDDAIEVFVGALRNFDRPMLLIDGAEQCVTPVVKLIDRLLPDVPSLRVVVTSRVRLSVPGEHVYEVHPLALPSDAEALETSAAGMLLLHRIRRLGAVAPTTTADKNAARALLKATDGFPLALELIAARLRLMSPAQLAAFIGESSHDDAASDPMSAAIETSFGLLSAPAQLGLAACSVFRGGFEVDAFLTVVPSTKDQEAVLSELRDNSMLTRSPDGRLDLYQPLREWVRHHAKEEVLGAARDDHASHYAQSAARYLRDPLAPGGRLIRELGNVRSAFEHVTSALSPGRVADALALLEVMCAFRVRLGHGELKGAASHLLAQMSPWIADGSVEGEARIQALTLAAMGSQQAFDQEGALGLATQALSELSSISADARRRLEPRVRLSLGIAQSRVGKRKEAIENISSALPMLEPTGHLAWRRDALHYLAITEHVEGNLDRARALYLEAADLSERAAMGEAARFVLLNALLLDMDRGALSEADHWVARLEAETDDLTSRRFRSTFTEMRSALAMAKGDFEESEQLLRTLTDTGLRSQADVLSGLAFAKLAQGDAEGARRACEQHLQPGTQGKKGDETGEALLLIARATVRSLGGDIDGALADLSDGMTEKGIAVDPRLGAVRNDGYAFVDLARAAQAASVTAQLDLFRRAEEVAASPEPKMPFHRALRAALRRQVDLGAPGNPALRVGRDGAWFEVLGRERIHLEGREASRMALALLSELRVRAPFDFASTDDMVSALWPDSTEPGSTLKNRLYVTINWLRKAGLEPLLQSTSAGYRLEPRLRCVLETTE